MRNDWVYSIRTIQCRESPEALRWPWVNSVPRSANESELLVVSWLACCRVVAVPPAVLLSIAAMHSLANLSSDLSGPPGPVVKKLITLVLLQWNHCILCLIQMSSWSLITFPRAGCHQWRHQHWQIRVRKRRSQILQLWNRLTGKRQHLKYSCCTVLHSSCERWIADTPAETTVLTSRSSTLLTAYQFTLRLWETRATSLLVQANKQASKRSICNQQPSRPTKDPMWHISCWGSAHE